MTTTVAVSTITVTPEASTAIREILQEKNLPNHAVRLFMSGGCCSGSTIGMQLDDRLDPMDLTFESNGIKILVDHESAPYVTGARIDFVQDPHRGTGFVVEGANLPAAHSHGHHGESGCACGGSCSCNS